VISSIALPLCPVLQRVGKGVGAYRRSFFLDARPVGKLHRLAISNGCRYGAAMSKIPICSIGGIAFAAALLAVILPAQAARSKKHHAEPPPKAAVPVAQSLGKFGSWTAYASQGSAGRVCYLVGQPKKSEPSGFARKAPMGMVTHRPAEKITNVVSFVEGYPLREGSEVALDIDGGKFAMFTKDDGAWARTSELDKTIAGALAKGKQAVVKGVSKKGPETTDVYSLSGFARALAAIDKACGVKREDSALPPPPAPSHHHRSRKHSAHHR
jgi:Invasion associated locus B (IalB) protein